MSRSDVGQGGNTIVALTKYKILKRLREGLLEELGVHETNGPKQAMRQELAPLGETRLAAGESLVAVPEGNWTEQGARPKVVETVELFDIDDLPDGRSVREGDPSGPDDLAQQDAAS